MMWQSNWDYECQTYVFADSVLCLGGISAEPIQVRENKIKWYLETRCLKEFNRIDGEPMEFEWKIYPGFTTLGILKEIQQFMTELQCELEQFKWRIIFMSMYNDIGWGEQGNTEKCDDNCCELCSQILARTLVILGTWIREEMVRNQWEMERRMGQNCRINDALFTFWKLSPDISCHQRTGTRSSTKQRKGGEVFSLQR